MAFRSPFVQHAMQLRDETREAYELHVLTQYDAAERATRGRLLNKRGERKGIDSASLFSGNAIRAYAYASPELVEWWETHPRQSFEQFERQAFANYQHTGSVG